MLAFNCSGICPVLYIFTALFYLLLWIRGLDIHLILNLFVHAPIQIMDTEKSQFRYNASLTVWIFAFQFWYTFNMFVYISLKNLWVYIACLLSVLSWVSAISFNLQEVMEILAINRANSCQLLKLTITYSQGLSFAKETSNYTEKKDFLSLNFYGWRLSILSSHCWW